MLHLPENLPLSQMLNEIIRLNLVVGESAGAIALGITLTLSRTIGARRRTLRLRNLFVMGW